LDPDILQIDFLPSNDQLIEHSKVKVNLDEILQSIYPLPKAPPCKIPGTKTGKSNYYILINDAAIEIITIEKTTKQIN